RTPADAAPSSALRTSSSAFAAIFAQAAQARRIAAASSFAAAGAAVSGGAEVCACATGAAIRQERTKRRTGRGALVDLLVSERGQATRLVGAFGGEDIPAFVASAPRSSRSSRNGRRAAVRSSALARRRARPARAVLPARRAAELLREESAAGALRRGRPEGD